ncbi:MAG: hypothetical protein H6565_09445 [Lewinellaceae bacterium]|nr:hypothetical protein [Lewinellaceae bacterium]MCB9354437.1 hypothetical protein [Lewinellaceae bacterium]
MNRSRSIRNKHFFVLICLSGIMLSVARRQMPNAEAPKLHLSEYGFFSGKLSNLAPAQRVYPYDVNAPLFSDYAVKARFFYLPERTKISLSDSLAWDFPEGSILIKNFFYPLDAGKPESGRRILETRLLLREEKGWKALEYLWNEDQDDATLEVAGAGFPVSWVGPDGKKKEIQYIAPNLNQCKGCHSYDGRFVPLGTSTRQLNRSVNGKNQLADWAEQGLLSSDHEFDPATLPQMVDYRLEHTTSAMLNEQARAYLDANCAHCHNPHGPAASSGMFLNIGELQPGRLGVNKPPVAAGRGSGRRKYGIVPGKPQESILVYRMESDDPGVRMPELGRQLPHKEGIDLIRSWIREMK